MEKETKESAHPIRSTMRGDRKRKLQCSPLQSSCLWSCSQCKRTYKRYDNYARHQRSCMVESNNINNGDDVNSKNNVLSPDKLSKRLSQNLDEKGTASPGHEVILAKGSWQNSGLERWQQLISRLNTNKEHSEVILSLHANVHFTTRATTTVNPSIVLSVQPSQGESFKVSQGEVLEELMRNTFNYLTSTTLDFHLHAGCAGRVPLLPETCGTIGTTTACSSVCTSKRKRKAERVLVRDNRYQVTDTSRYPYNAVALMKMKLWNPDKKRYMWYEGTGFLAEGYRFYTCAHNVIVVLKNGEKRKAQAVKLLFGLNSEQQKDKNKLKEIIEIELSGNDFTIPEGFQEETDINDFAYADLRKHRRSLPTEWFYTCTIPATLGLISGQFFICGYPETKTQWEVSKVRPRRDEEGHLLYKEATSEGQSGSPLYCFDEEGRALVVAVHVGGSEVSNYAVPISQHLPTWNKVGPFRKYGTRKKRGEED